MSHELRTPLNAVIGFAEVIAGEMFGPVGTPRYKGYAEMIRVSGAHLLQIIADILDLAKIEADHVVLDERPVSVRGARQCDTLVATRADEAGVRSGSALPPSLPHLVADELRSSRSCSIFCRTRSVQPAGSEVQLAADAPDGGIDIVIRDHGCGMTVTKSPGRAAVPSGQQRDREAQRGTGLGLPLAKGYRAAWRAARDRQRARQGHGRARSLSRRAQRDGALGRVSRLSYFLRT
jgi:signal transduction histidine kinase